MVLCHGYIQGGVAMIKPTRENYILIAEAIVLILVCIIACFI